MTITRKIKKLILICIIVNIAAIIILGIGIISFTEDNGNVEVVAMDMGEPEKPMNNDEFIKVSDLIPDIVIELRYGTERNITGKNLYTDNTAYLRLGTAQKLKKANEELKKLGLRIKIWDAYRPRAVQYELWKKEPDVRYIVDPKRGSVHSRGAAIDITLVDKNGKEVKMPTDFDTFSKKGDRNYRDVDAEAAENSMLLENIMYKNGFKGAKTEWWHFSDLEWSKYPLVDRVSIKDKEEKLDIKIAPSEDKTPEFITSIRDKIAKFDMDGFLAGIKYQISRVKEIFGEYGSEE